MPVLVYFLYVLFAPATAFTDGTCLPEYAVHVSRAQELCGLHFGPTQNQLFHGNDGPYSANRSPGQEILGRCAMSPSTASSGPTMGNPELVKKLSDQEHSWNVSGDSNHTGNGNHCSALDSTHSSETPVSATLPDTTLEDVTDSTLEQKNEVQNSVILSAVKELANSMHGMISGIPEKVRSVIDVRNWKDTICNYVDNKTREFAEKVRSVINEEFYKLLDSMWEMIKALPDSGK